MMPSHNNVTSYIMLHKLILFYNYMHISITVAAAR